MKNRLMQKSIYYILVSLILLAVYPLDLYFPTGNQCIYFFWGLKNAEYGFLSNDFLATQPDPFPLFSWLVTYSYNFLGNNIFLFWYWLLNLVYVIAFFEIAEEISNRLGWQINKPLFLTFFLFVNSTAIWGFLFEHFFNFDLRWVWDSGFAEQGVLRGYLQPSVFGVFILLSFALFIKKRFLIAFISAALAACFHANYFLVSGVFIFIYVAVLIKEKNYKTAIIGSVISLLITVPYLIYIFKNFSSTSPETVDYISSHIKGHLHFDYHVWMNGKALLQLLVITFSLWLVRKTVLFFPMVVALSVLVLLTALTYFSGSIFLLNLTPWRISVILVPVAVSIIIAHLSASTNLSIRNLIYCIIYTFIFSALVFRIFGNSSEAFMLKWRILTAGIFILANLKLFVLEKYFSKINFKITYAPAAIILLVALGISGFVLHRNDNSQETELKTFVRKNATAKQQYLIPPQLTDFRITTGVPVFADSTIYHSNTLPLWDKKIKAVNRFYANNDSVLLDSLTKNCGITHIIVQNETALKQGKEIFSNGRYTIFELNER